MRIINNIGELSKSFKMAFKETVYVCREMSKKDKLLKHTGFTYFNIMEFLDKCDEDVFTKFCVELYKANGYKVKVISKNNIVASKDNKSVFVKCKKCDRNSKLNIDKIINAYESCLENGYDDMVIITNSDFTKRAYDLLKNKDCFNFIGYRDILNLLLEMNPISISNILNKVA